MTFNEHLSKIAHNRTQERLGSTVHKIATFTRCKALEVSVERGLTNVLPDDYLKEVSTLEARDKEAVARLMDERLKLWQELLL